ncbi:ExeM/NucH family extracellular endonuclease [Thioalkalivibrio sp. ALE20]|uniref:ExeM/NucH family extracellular endonuclease n=1 Tax=Thioalkalivibrio sp. ALE20 TaxID=545275 RepID=UPI000379DBBD|nr:ExeM/NucH family extracellular endonuclease [Thioalkalivibrio sp. ALE20]
MHAPTRHTPRAVRNPRAATAALILLLAPALPGAATADCPAPPADERMALDELRAGAVDEDQPVVAEGTVSGVFHGEDALGGFYLQDDATDPPTGLFVYAPDRGDADLQPGDRVQVHARFGRHHGRPQLSRVQALERCRRGEPPQAVTLRLPEDADRLEGLEDVRVRFDQTLTVTANRELARYGSLDLAAGGRLRHPGQTGEFGDPDAGDGDGDRRIVLDDGSYRARPDPVPYLDNAGTRRVGSRVDGLTGILTHAFDAHRVHPVQPPQWEGGERPDPPPEPGDDTLRIATANLENDFVTLGERGAQDPAERERQTAKLDAQLAGLAMDVLAFVELENRPAAGRELRERVDALDERTHMRKAAHPDSGSDAIQVGLLYDRERVELLDTAADGDSVHHRPPLLGWFRSRDGGEPFGVVAVHFKAKTGCPEHGDIDRGQGCWNQRRTEQAERLAEWIARQRAARPDDPPVIIAGDLNSYAAEDPLAALRAAGKEDLVATAPENIHTYVFRGRSGQLDYLLGPEALAARVVAADTWAVNADEPVFLGFDGAHPADGPWRASDHDPVWLDLRP